jgi:hypothetical protein
MTPFSRRIHGQADTDIVVPLFRVYRMIDYPCPRKFKFVATLRPQGLFCGVLARECDNLNQLLWHRQKIPSSANSQPKLWSGCKGMTNKTRGGQICLSLSSMMGSVDPSKKTNWQGALMELLSNCGKIEVSELLLSSTSGR